MMYFLDFWVVNLDPIVHEVDSARIDIKWEDLDLLEVRYHKN